MSGASSFYQSTQGSLSPASNTREVEEDLVVLGPALSSQHVRQPGAYLLRVFGVQLQDSSCASDLWQKSHCLTSSPCGVRIQTRPSAITGQALGSALGLGTRARIC